MAAAEEVPFSLKVIVLKESNKVLYAEVESDFADVLLSFLTLPLGTIVRLLNKHYGNDAPILGSLNSLYAGLLNLDKSHFCTEAGKLMLLNPRNSSGIQCSRLKLQIDDTPPIQYFICGNWTCVSMYYTMKCLCPHSTKIKITRKDFEIEARGGEESVFTAQTSFLLTDDLQILTNSSASFFQILKQNGVEDLDILEERTLIVGLKEIMELLKESLVSRTPLTDITLRISSSASTMNKGKKFLSAKYEPDTLSQTQTGKNVSSDSKKITVKALVQKSTNRVLLAQTEHDFIDFLFSLLTIPLGGVQFLLGDNTCLGSINNLYRSIPNLDVVKYMKSRETITGLLEPQIPPYYLSFNQFFSLNQQISPAIYRGVENNTHKLFLSIPNNGICTKMKMIDPKGQDGFVEGPKMFMVTDDLIVSTPPSTSILSTLAQMKIPPSDVEEQELEIGMEEALSILKASLVSTRALTEGLKPFLKRQPKQEK